NQFLLGGSYHRETTVYPADFSDSRVTFHSNMSHMSTGQRFKTNFSLTYSSEKNNLPVQDLTSYINLPPDFPQLYDSLGRLNWSQKGFNFFNNPMAVLLKKYEAKTENLLGNLNVSYKITRSLNAKVNFGYNSINVNEFSSNPIASLNSNFVQKGSSNFSDNHFKSWIIEPQAEYGTTIGKGQLSLLVGGSWQEITNNNTAVAAAGFTSDAVLKSIAAAGSVTGNSNYTQYHYQALFGRVNYNLAEKYIINVSGRRDGSSRFGPGKQYGNFGAVGVAWIFSNESFLSQQQGWLSFGKLRGSYGVTGNDQIGDYKFLNSYSSAQYPYNNSTALVPYSLFNPDYAWEVNHKLEATLEVGFLKDRVLLSGTYYRNRSSNQLINYSLPTQTGFASVLQNLPAVVQNSGSEFSLTTQNIHVKDFTWSASIFVTVPENKLISFPDLDSSAYADLFAEGQSLNVVKGYRFTGIDASTGVFTVEDKNGDGSIDGKDFYIIGKLNPKYYGGFSNTFTYKGIQAYIFFEGRKQQGASYLRTIYQKPPGTMNNQPVAVLDHWQKTGDNNQFQKFTQAFSSQAYQAVQNYLLSDAVLTDASFIRLKTVSLSYSLPSRWLQRAHLSNLTIFVQGQNLATFTNYVGTDPESQNLYSLPPLKTYVGGIQITF
ncbi:MAG: SusC/RagA family TonB-linked outer membrane protein, partial [Flavisolibacter sp.]